MEEPKCLSIDEWIKKSGVYRQWNITQPQKEWNNAIWSNIDGPRDDHTEKDEYWMISLICGI